MATEQVAQNEEQANPYNQKNLGINLMTKSLSQQMIVYSLSNLRINYSTVTT